MPAMPAMPPFASSADWIAFALMQLIALQAWLAWGLIQNQRVQFDRRRFIALAIGMATTAASWCEIVFMRDTPRAEEKRGHE